MGGQERLFVLEASGGGRLFSVHPDGSDRTVLVTGCRIPDGVASAPGTSTGRTWVSRRREGVTHTPKQLHLEPADRKLYWGDREGMRVLRCDLDGSNVETLVRTGEGEDDRRDETNWCVGVTVDPVGGHLYWSQKGPSDAGLGRILRAGLALPAGQTPDRRGDVEVLFQGLPEPIDLELDLKARALYWTDRGTRRGATPSTGPRWTRRTAAGRPRSS